MTRDYYEIKYWQDWDYFTLREMHEEMMCKYIECCVAISEICAYFSVNLWLFFAPEIHN